MIKYAPSPASNSRVGIIISKKVDKRAVKRNHLRRVIMHALLPHLSLIAKPHDLVFILKKTVSDLTDEELKDTVATFLAKELLK